VLTVLTHLQTNTAFVLQDEVITQKALDLFNASQAAFSDCVILAQAQREGLVVYTFDKRLTKLEGAQAVQPSAV
jgi:predicted nucleic-acid-binding protein